ncbi:MAG: aminotransferase class V-fold PLP-dependent enzyme, partial [Bacteroidetes bacterium]|nr:aminotransferase class V-fold PLP-dependent enzyme [Bacteroidota bacterium]
RLLNCKKQEIAFIKNTSHGLSLIAKGIEWRKGDSIIVFEKEFPANLYTWLDLKRLGVEVRQAQLINGRVQTAEIEKLIDKNTRLLSISSVQFTNGYRADLESIGKICKENNILFVGLDVIGSIRSTDAYVFSDGSTQAVASTPSGFGWRVSTAVFKQTFSVSGQETGPEGIFFKPDGTKMYVLGSSGDNVNEYDLGLVIEGKVGIGTINPTAKLDVNGTGPGNLLRVGDATN